MQRFERVESSLKRIVVDNFIGGISWGLGATFGVSIVLAIFGLVLKKINLIPIIGDFVINIMSFISQNNPNLIK